MKKKISIIFGGRSSEHEVSIRSAINIYKALDKNQFEAILIGISKQGTWYLFSEKNISEVSSLNDLDLKDHTAVSFISYHGKPYILNLQTHEKISFDCAFPIVHGTNGEDGTLQGLFKMINVPFVGCGVLGSAICMDKEYMKIAMTFANIPNSKFQVLRKNEKNDFFKISKNLGLPFFIKPANAGSSVGVHKIKSEIEFHEKLKDSFQYDHKIIAEEFIQGREIECSVMGINNSPEAATPGELVVKHEFYSYEAKYLDENGAEIIIPAKLSEIETEKIRKLAVETYTALSCDGMARVDFFMKSDSSLIVNEVNTLPGFTKISMYPMMWQARGLNYSDLITKLINLAFQKYNQDQEIKLTF
jgi:D-alanine-D-alanine ligase